MVNYAGDKLKELLQLKGRSLQDLSDEAGLHTYHWARFIKGSVRLSVDMALRLAKVFPIERVNEEAPLMVPRDYWLGLQFKSDLENAAAQDGAMYQTIKPL